MAFTEGKTNKECSYLGGLGGMEENKSRYAKVGFAPKKLRLPNSGHVMVRK